jgi:hypothetical protein
MRAKVAIFTTLVASTAIACSVLGDDSASQGSAHRAGEPTFATHEWLWANESLDEFRSNGAQNALAGAPDAFPSDHPMAARLQFWIDAMDAALRARYPDKLKSVPKPEVVLLQSGFPNAWVTRLPVGWAIPAHVDVDAGEFDGGAPDPFLGTPTLLLPPEGRVDALWHAPFARPVDDAKVGEFVAFANAGYAHCRLSFSGGALALGRECISAPPPVLEGTSFAYYATAKHISVTPSYLYALETEEPVVIALAHELGHYYRSHANLPIDLSNYFYSLEGGHHADKPLPDPRFLAETERARDKIRTRAFDYSDENQLMVDKNVGFYTVEQEADEIGLELGALVGIDPSAGIDEVLALQKYIDDQWGGFGMAQGTSWADCTKLRERGFKDAGGDWTTVPVGDLLDAHHSWCFRAFNMQREIEAHAYRLEPRPQSPAAPWASLLDSLRVEAPPPPPIDFPKPAADAGND